MPPFCFPGQHDGSFGPLGVSSHLRTFPWHQFTLKVRFRSYIPVGMEQHTEICVVKIWHSTVSATGNGVPFLPFLRRGFDRCARKHSDWWLKTVSASSEFAPTVRRRVRIIVPPGTSVSASVSFEFIPACLTKFKRKIMSSFKNICPISLFKDSRHNVKKNICRSYSIYKIFTLFLKMSPGNYWTE